MEELKYLCLNESKHLILNKLKGVVFVKGGRVAAKLTADAMVFSLKAAHIICIGYNNKVWVVRSIDYYPPFSSNLLHFSSLY